MPVTPSELPALFLAVLTPTVRAATAPATVATTTVAAATATAAAIAVFATFLPTTPVKPPPRLIAVIRPTRNF